MTDRIHSFTVVLDKDVREDEVERLRTALTMIKGVLSVAPHVSDVQAHMARERVRHELAGKLWEVLKPKWLDEEPR